MTKNILTKKKLVGGVAALGLSSAFLIGGVVNPITPVFADAVRVEAPLAPSFADVVEAEVVVTVAVADVVVRVVKVLVVVVNVVVVVVGGITSQM